MTAGRLVVVLGSPNSGKTTLIKELGRLLEGYSTYVAPRPAPGQWAEALSQVSARPRQ